MGFGEPRPDVGFLGRVAGMHFDARMRCVCGNPLAGVVERVVAPPHYQHRRAVLGQKLGAGLADPAAGAGDERGLAGKGGARLLSHSAAAACARRP
jgi:hypothetical protein